jgi:hypothetical protein
MDLISLAAIVMLVIWGVATFAYNAPGYVHLLLTVGVFLLIWRIVVRGTEHRARETHAASEPAKPLDR